MNIHDSAHTFSGGSWEEERCNMDNKWTFINQFVNIYK